MIRRLIAASLVFSATLLAIGFGDAGAVSYPAVVCNGGDIAAGDYQSIRVVGVCDLPGGNVTVHGDVRLDPGSILNGVTDAELTVLGSVYVGPGAALGLGCSPAADCDTTTHDTIMGNLIATQPLALILHSDTIKGSVVSLGGGGGVTCDTPLLGGPAFSTFEDLTIGGDLLVSNLQSCWVGFFRNSVGRVMNIRNNVMDDPDAMEIADNNVHVLLTCYGNSPTPQVGDSGGGSNTAPLKFGQCRGL